MTVPTLSGETALVTGATRGIGRAIAAALSKAGASVVGTATTEAGAETISDALGDAGAGVRMDVNDSDSVTAAVDFVGKKFGAVTVLVNNAGITRDNLLLRMKEEEWEAALDTNLKSVYRLSRACLRGMTRARRGRIINITSVVGFTGNPGQGNYAAAKAGIGGFTRALALEVASRNITVNAVAPGFIETDMTATLDAARRERLRAAIPLGRLGAAEDVAAAVAFLAGPAAGYITGATLHVNGGMFMA